MENIVVTNLDLVTEDNLYLSNDWKQLYPKSVIEGRKLMQQQKLYIGYIVNSKTYCLYKVMDATCVLITFDGTIVVNGQNEVIDNKFEKCMEI